MPPQPGVYFLLAENTELLYVGKASNLRTRLAQHARAAGATTDVRLRALYARTGEVRWEAAPDEAAAAAREADVIVALQPRFNASIVDEGRWNYVTIEPGRHGPASMRLGLTPSTDRPAQAYGCFPHLGHGLSSGPGIACSDGYTALLRLLWVCSTGGTLPIPSRLSTGRVCDAIEIPVPAAWRAPLHALLSGTSCRLLADLAVVETAHAPHLRSGLLRDAVAAESFFRHGPVAVRRLRLRHGRRGRTITRDQVRAMVTADLHEAIGPFRLPVT
ncbi:MAG TPA: GIY-YIG nuclease family protein [Acidimicrobiia bacterium]|nr:GIY-YIG nuclease family protein [Acidimicrobiia bacterium]